MLYGRGLRGLAIAVTTYASERAVESLRGLALTVTLPVSSQHCLTWHLDNKYVFIVEHRPTLHSIGMEFF